MEASKNKDLLSLTHTGDEYDKYLHAVVPPVFLNSLHVFKTFEEYSNVNIYEEDSYVYGRDSNPTVNIVERKVAELEHGVRAVAFSSGMAAATAAIMATCKAGSHILCLRDVYQPVKRFLSNICIPNLNMSVTYVTGLDLDELESKIQENTSLIILESPATFVFTVIDIKAVTDIAKRHVLKLTSIIHIVLRYFKNHWNLVWILSCIPCPNTLGGIATSSGVYLSPRMRN